VFCVLAYTTLTGIILECSTLEGDKVYRLSQTTDGKIWTHSKVSSSLGVTSGMRLEGFYSEMAGQC
jgi:hypothetical protein